MTRSSPKSSQITDSDKAIAWICIGWKKVGHESVCKKLIPPKAINASRALQMFKIKHPELRNHTVQPG